jgi:hypothetical protein
MSASAARSQDNVVSLEDYRRARASHRKDAVDTMPAMPMRAAQAPGPVWVYWVPVWIW